MSKCAWLSGNSDFLLTPSPVHLTWLFRSVLSKHKPRPFVLSQLLFEHWKSPPTLHYSTRSAGWIHLQSSCVSTLTKQANDWLMASLSADIRHQSHSALLLCICCSSLWNIFHDLEFFCLFCIGKKTLEHERQKKKTSFWLVWKRFGQDEISCSFLVVSSHCSLQWTRWEAKGELSLFVFIACIEKDCQSCISA